MVDSTMMPETGVKNKKKRKKGVGSIMEIYDLEKVKVNIELDHLDHKMRGLAVFKLKLKDREQVI